VRATCVGALLLFICTVPGARTAAVLGQHAVGRVEDAYTAFQPGAREVGTRVAVGEDSDGPGLIDNERLKTSLEDTFGPLVPIFFISVIASEGQKPAACLHKHDPDTIT